MKIKKLAGLIAICVLGAISLGSFFGLARTTMNDIAGFDFKTVNEANVFYVGNYNIENSPAVSMYSISDDGEITFNIRAADKDPTQSFLVNIQDINLEPGEYVFKSGNRNCSRDTYCLVLYETSDDGSIVDGGDVIYADTSFKVTGTSSVKYTAYLYVAVGAECDGETFTPILVEKGEKAKFYIYDFNPFDNAN